MISSCSCSIYSRLPVSHAARTIHLKSCSYSSLTATISNATFWYSQLHSPHLQQKIKNTLTLRLSNPNCSHSTPHSSTDTLNRSRKIYFRRINFFLQDFCILFLCKYNMAFLLELNNLHKIL